MSSNGQLPTAQIAGLDAALAALALTVQDENADVAANVNVIDFQGAGVTAAVGGTGEVVVTIPGGGGGGSSSGLLAVATATTSAAYSTTSTTSVAMDATNLSVTFTAPASGAVLITQTGYATTNSTTIGAYEWSVITTAAVEVQVCSLVSKQTTLARRIATYYITGLTPGNSYTYRWGHRQVGGITGTTYTGGNSGTSGNTIMTVAAA